MGKNIAGRTYTDNFPLAKIYHRVLLGAFAFIFYFLIIEIEN